MDQGPALTHAATSSPMVCISRLLTRLSTRILTPSCYTHCFCVCAGMPNTLGQWLNLLPRTSCANTHTFFSYSLNTQCNNWYFSKLGRRDVGEGDGQLPGSGFRRAHSGQGLGRGTRVRLRMTMPLPPKTAPVCMSQVSALCALMSAGPSVEPI